MGSGDYAWMLTSTALVVFMVPGLALFYGGMVRSRNVLNMLLMNLACIGIVPIVWVLVSYSLGNSSDGSGFFGGDWIGNFDAIGLKGLNGDAESLIFVAFLMTFASITPALISGSVAGRLKFSAWLVFVPVWLLLVYTPVTYWVYSGWQHGNGALDFAGGTAIHLNAGVAALAVVLVLGRRRGWPSEAMPPHNVPMVLIGTGILWFGWFGFNVMSAQTLDGISGLVAVNSLMAMVGGILVSMLLGRKDPGFIHNGPLAGLVAVCAGSDLMHPVGALVTGGVAGAIFVYLFEWAQAKIERLDDVLGVWPLHGVCGVWGAIACGIFGQEALGGLGGVSLMSQIIGSVAGVVVAFVGGLIVYGVINAISGLRLTEEEEFNGADLSIHRIGATAVE